MNTTATKISDKDLIHLQGITIGELKLKLEEAERKLKEAVSPTAAFPGMSLRDWFAGMALQSIVLSHDSSGVDVVATTAYQYADAMLAERSRSK